MDQRQLIPPPPPLFPSRVLERLFVFSFSLIPFVEFHIFNVLVMSFDQTHFLCVRFFLLKPTAFFALSIS